MIHAEYKVSFGDFLDSMRAYRGVSKGAAFIYYLDVWVVPLLGLALTSFPLVLYLQHDYEGWSTWDWLCILGFFLMVITPLVYRTQLYQAYRQRVSLASNSAIRLDFDEVQLRFTIPGKTEVSYAWSAFTKFAESDRTATLLVGRAAFHTIPKAAMNQESWSALRELVRGTAGVS